MKTSTWLLAITLPTSLLLGCQSGTGGLPAANYSSTEQERTMVNEMNLHRPGKTGAKAASRQDNTALREDLTEHPVRSQESQSSSGTVNEMVEGEGLPRPK
jgi:hypothetical protein